MVKQNSKRRWILPFVSGIVLTLAGWGIWRRAHPPVDPLIAEMARETNSDPLDLKDAFALMNEAGEGELADDRWSRLKQLFGSSSSEVKQVTVSAMLGLSRSRRRSEVVAMVKPLLQDPHWRTQNQALILLRRFNDPSWRIEATKRLNSPDENIRSNAQVQFRLSDSPRKQPSPTASGISQ